MSNLVGESIPPYVAKQIQKRQETYGSGTPGNPRSLEEISSLNSRNAWIKLASGTSMEKSRIKLLKKAGNTLGGDTPGKTLAEGNVLFGGISSKVGNTLESRQGIEGPNRAYGIGGKAFGFAPMPGIIDASIKSLNRGSLKKATINIKAHNKNQLDIIDVLYMRLGYTVLLEWGNNKYINNKGDFTTMGPTLIESYWFTDKADNTDYTEWLPLIEQKRGETSGNYEAMFGTISNFSWTFESDGSYSVKIEIISMGDVIESLKVNVPLSPETLIDNISYEDFLKTQQGSDLYKSVTITGNLTSKQFKDDFVDKTTGEVDPGLANAAGYYEINKGDFSKYVKKWDLENTPLKNYQIKRLENLELYYSRISQFRSREEDEIHYKINNPGIYKDKDGKSWYFEFDNLVLYEIIHTNDTGRNTYDQAIDEYTNTRKKQVAERTVLIENQIKILSSSKLAYLFFSIRELGGNRSHNPQIPLYNININDRSKEIGVILSQNGSIRDEFIKLGLPFYYKEKGTSKEIYIEKADIILLDKVTLGKHGENPYYIRFGKLLEYIKNHILPKIITKNTLSSPPILGIDTDPDKNVMYTLPHQLSTNPSICILTNQITFEGDPPPTKNFFGQSGAYKGGSGLAAYVGESSSGIRYGKVMNIYLNISYIENLLLSDGIVNSISLYKFLQNICNDINESLGGINNLEPVIDESSNTVYILEQTSIPGKNQLIEDLGIRNVKGLKPIIQVFGYNNDTNSNFVRNVGLQTAITKEYATLISIGATSNGYIPGEEAVAFSKWNHGVIDRFKKGWKGGDSSDSNNPITIFKEDNIQVVENYTKYINQKLPTIMGFNPLESNDDKKPEGTYVPNKKLIESNTAAVTNFYKYLQASASLAHADDAEIIESSVGFLPFNLNLTMDGISGFKIYNKLEVNTDFLPSNYDKTMDFVITGVDHKLSNNEWVTDLSTIGTSIGTSNPSIIDKIVMGKFTDYSPGVNYVAIADETALQKPHAYIIENGDATRGGFGRRYSFEDLGTHHDSGGSVGYFDDEDMRLGKVSARMAENTMMVYDMVLWSQAPGTSTSKTECWLPSPISGKMINRGKGADSITTIKGDDGTIVKMLHMNIILGAVGDKITKGQVIGRQGNIMSSTTVSANYHLHIQAPKQVLKDYIIDLVKENASLSTPYEPKSGWELKGGSLPVWKV